MERVVIVGYKPFNGKNELLKKLALTHWNRLNELGLVTNRKPIIIEAQNGTIIEIFGWKSKLAMEQAHNNPKVIEMWEEYAKVCDYVPLSSVPETQKLFSEFSPV